VQKPPPAFFVFFAVALSIIAGVHAYVGVQVIGGLGLTGIAATAAWAALVLSALSIPAALLGRFLLKPPLADQVAWVGLTLMGFMSFMLLGAVLRDLVLGGLGLIGALPTEPTVRAELVAVTGAALLPAGLMATGLGFYFARRTPPVVDVEVRVPGLDPRLVGLRIVQISDIHVGPTIKRDRIARMVSEIDALDADVVAITGDLVDGSVASLREHTAPIADLRARHGVFFVTGNHEYYAGAEAWIAELRRLGLTVLLNEHRVLEHGGAPFVVAGVTDYSAGRMLPEHTSDPRRAAAGAPPGVFKLLLAHQPRSAYAAAEAGFDLQLSGHTHGGQFVPWNLFVPLQQPFTHSLRTMGRLQVYTSRGTGYWGPPVRLGASSEITRLTLAAA
jgi:predicted MPP superfamily phosphohydrolase